MHLVPTPYYTLLVCSLCMGQSWKWLARDVWRPHNAGISLCRCKPNDDYIPCPRHYQPRCSGTATTTAGHRRPGYFSLLWSPAAEFLSVSVFSMASSTNHSNSPTVLQDKGHYSPHAFCLCFMAQAALLDLPPLCSVILWKAWSMTTGCGAGQQAESSTGEWWINDCLFRWFLCGLHEIAIVNLKLQSTSSGKILQLIVISNLLKTIGRLSWNQSSHFQSIALPEAAGSLSPFDTFLRPEAKAWLQIPVQ